MPQLAGVEHRYATVRGVRIHYAEAGEGDPVVLQHGWPQHWWEWRHQIGPLVDSGYRVTCPDMRGHGWSEKPRTSYRKDELMADLMALLDELGLDRVRYVGHDWGAYVGMLAALEHPDRIERLVALSMPHPWQRRRLDPRQGARIWYQFVLAAPVLGKLSVARLGFPAAILRTGGHFDDEEIATYADVLHEPDAAEASMRMYRHFLRYDLPRYLGELRRARLRVPTLWLIGEDDPVAGGADDGYRDFSDDMTLEFVPGASHFLPEETPELVTERVLGFLGAAQRTPS